MDIVIGSSLNLCNNYIDKNIANFKTSIVKNNTEDETVGNEAFDFIDKAFFSIDKAFESGIKNIIDYFQTTNIFLEDIEEYSTKTVGINNLYKLRPEFMDRMKEIPFHSVSRRKTPVMLGLDIKFKDIVTILEKNQAYIKGIEDTLGRFEQELDDLINSKKDNIKLDIDINEVKAILDNAKHINNDLNKTTNTHRMVDRLPLKNVTSNFKELLTSINDVLRLGTVYRMENLEILHSTNEDINIKMDVIYESIKNNKSSMEKSSLKDFIDYIESIAKYITAISFLYYLYFQTVDMLVAAIKIIEIEEHDDSVLKSIGYSLKIGFTTIKDFFSNLTK